VERRLRVAPRPVVTRLADRRVKEAAAEVPSSIAVLEMVMKPVGSRRSIRSHESEETAILGRPRYLPAAHAFVSAPIVQFGTSPSVRGPHSLEDDCLSDQVPRPVEVDRLRPVKGGGRIAVAGDDRVRPAFSAWYRGASLPAPRSDHVGKRLRLQLGRQAVRHLRERDVESPFARGGLIRFVLRDGFFRCVARDGAEHRQEEEALHVAPPKKPGCTAMSFPVMRAAPA
jgi:hypothetical protein